VEDALEKKGVKQDLSERFISGGRVFEGGFLRVQRDRVRLPDGSETQREYILHPGAVAIVALLDDRRIILERQHRYPHRRDFIEVPAGKRESGEPGLSTAQRELLEETGYVAAQWSRLGVIHNAIAYSDESIEIYEARGLTQRAAKLDQGEFLEVLALPFDEALAMARDGRITDAKTISALFFAMRAATAG
jgi:ADP-ribose pyrophosphatase